MSGAIVYDDEMPLSSGRRGAGRNVDDERTQTVKGFDGKETAYIAGAYDEYAILWARYMRLAMKVVKRNQYVIGPTGLEIIPRIQDLIDKEAAGSDYRKELEEYQANHIAVWKEMENVIDALSQNAYVKRRTHNSAEQLHHFTNGLYAQIRN